MTAGTPAIFFPTQSKALVVGAVMSYPVLWVAPGTRVKEARRIAIEAGVRHLLVSTRGDLVGVLSLVDLRGADADDTVASRMGTAILTIDRAATLHEAADIVRERCIGCLPVLDRGRVVGIVTRGDLRRAGLSHDEILGGRVCSACRSFHDVRSHPVMEGVSFCLECMDLARPPEPFEECELGGSG